MGILDARARSAERTDTGWQLAASFASSCHLRRCDASAGPPKPASQTNGKVCEDLWPMLHRIGLTPA
jgi:hypothetical protein